MSAKVVSAVFSGILLGLYIHHDYVKWNSRGRSEFLAYQAARFDLHMSHPPALLGELLAAVAVCITAIGFYELVANGLSKIVNSRDHASAPEK
jgi:hypothetical protein